MSESYSVEAVLSARDAGFIAGMEHAEKAAGGLGKTVSGLGKNIAGTFKFGALMRAGGKAFDLVTNSARNLAGELSASQATWKTFEGNMTNFGKSSKTILKVRGDLQKFATETIYSASDMASTYSQLAAVGTKNTTNLVKAFGGLAAAAENPQQAMKTLSQQATQMAAKPMVQWMDFKLMLEQTPAGIAAVAGAMNRSTSQLIKDVQDGKVKTEEFFKAMQKAAGEGTKFNKMATTYKTMGQAMDGLSETLTTKLQPAFDTVSDYGIKAISKLTDFIDEKLDGSKLAKSIQGITEGIKSEGLDGIITKAKQAGAAVVAFGVASKAFEFYNQNAELISIGTDKIKSKVSTLPSLMTRLQTKVTKTGVTIKNLIPKSLNSTKRSLKNFGTSLSEFGSQIALSMEAISPKLSDAGVKVWEKFDSIGAKISTSGGKTVNIIKKKFNNMSSAVGSVTGNISSKVGTIVKPFQTMAGQIGGALGKIGGAVVQVGGRLASGLKTMMGVALKALFPAALIGAALAGMGVLYQQFGTQIDQILAMVQTKGPQVISNFVSGITSALPSLIASGAQMLAGLLDTITALAPSLIQAGVDIIAALVSGLGSALPTLLPSAINMVGTIVTGLLGAIPQLLSVGMQFLVQLSAGIASNIPLLITKAQEAISGFVQGISSNLPTILQSAVQIVQNLITGITQGLPALITTGISLLMQLGQAIISNLPTIIQSGVQVVASLAMGIVQAIPQVLSAIVEGVGQIITTITSTNWLEVGINVAKAIGTGILNGLGPIGQKIASFFHIDTDWAGSGKKGGADVIKGANQGVTANAGSFKSSMGQIGTQGTNALTTNIKSGASKAGNALKPFEASLKTTTTQAATSGKQTGEQYSNNVKTGLDKGVSQAKASGTKVGTGFTTSLRSSLAKAPSVATSAVNSVASKLRAGYGAAHSAGAHIGQGVAAGLRSALGAVTAAANAIVAQANRAMQAKAKIHSPSKLTNKEVGQPLAQGVAKGMKKKTKEVAYAGKLVVFSVINTISSLTKKKKVDPISELFTYTSSTVSSLAKTSKGYARYALSQLQNLAASTEGKYSDSWSSVSKTVKDGLESSQEKALKASKTKTKALADKYYGADVLNKQITKNSDKLKKNKSQISSLQIANRNASKAQKKINNKKITALKKSNQKLSNKNTALNKKLTKKQKKSDKLYTAVYAQYETYIKSETEKAVAAIEDSMGKITSKYQALYDKVADQRSTFESKMKDYGSLFTADTYGYVKFKDWNAQIKNIQTLKTNLQQLQKAGVSQGFLSEITSMSTSEALTYTNALIQKGTGFIREQSKGFEALMSNASSVSSTVYKPYVDAIDKAYNQDLVNSLSGLEATLNQIGQNAAKALADGLSKVTVNAGITKATKKASSKTGKATQTGYSKGVKKSTKKSTKATKKAAGKNTKAAKKKLKVHSPSRVFMGIARNVGLGYVKGLDSMKRLVRNVSMDMVNIPSADSPRLAYAGAGLNDNYSYGGARYEVTVVSELDGREIARATADPMQEELDKRNSRNNRNRGNR